MKIRPTPITNSFANKLIASKVPSSRAWPHWYDKSCKLERALAEAIEQRNALAEALKFYADVSKYPAPFTGGFGDLYFDCGSIASKALKSLEKGLNK